MFVKRVRIYVIMSSNHVSLPTYRFVSSVFLMFEIDLDWTDSTYIHFWITESFEALFNYLQSLKKFSAISKAYHFPIFVLADQTGECVPHGSQRSCNLYNIPQTTPSGGCIKGGTIQNWKSNCAKLITSKSTSAAALAAVTLASSVATSSLGKPNAVVCTSYKRIDDQTHPAVDQQLPISSTPSSMNATILGSASIILDPSAAAIDATGRDVILDISSPLLDFSRFNPDDYPIEDCDETARIQRALEIAEGVEPPPGFMPNVVNAAPLVASFATVPKTIVPTAESACASAPPVLPISTTATVVSNALLNANWHSFSAQIQMDMPNLSSAVDDAPRIVIHSQVEANSQFFLLNFQFWPLSFDLP